MNPSKHIFALIFLLCCGYAMAQQKKTTFYINPHIGGEWPISKFENGPKPPYITGAFLDLTDKFGIGLLADIDNKFTVELGIGWGNIGWGVKYKSKTDSARYSTSGGEVFSTTVRRLYLSFSKPLKSVKIKRRKSKDFLGGQLKLKDEYKYWAIFDLGIIGGISQERTLPFFHNPGGTSTFSGSGTDAISISNPSVIRKNSHGFGAFIGINAQFYQLGDKKFQIGVLYHQGFKKRIISTWETSINGVEFPSFNVFTRGSGVAMYISWPIKLFTINQK